MSMKITVFWDMTLYSSVYISILCLTTDPIHQGHEKRKKSGRQHVHRATRPRSYAIDKVWEEVTSRCLGNGRSDSRCKQYGGVQSIICYLCFMQHAWSCFFFIYLYSLILLYCISNITRPICERYGIPFVRVNLYCFFLFPCIELMMATG